MMRLETKIFYGAFLALLAFYAVIKLPGEIKRITASRREVELRSTLHSLTPVLLTKRCGPPTKDAAFVSYGDYLWRDLEYKSGLVTFRFSNATGDTKKKPDENDPKKWSVSVVGFDGKSDDNLAREMMPCALKLK